MTDFILLYKLYKYIYIILKQPIMRSIYYPYKTSNHVFYVLLYAKFGDFLVSKL